MINPVGRVGCVVPLLGGNIEGRTRCQYNRTREESKIMASSLPRREPGQRRPPFGMELRTFFL